MPLLSQSIFARCRGRCVRAVAYVSLLLGGGRVRTVLTVFAGIFISIDAQAVAMGNDQLSQYAVAGELALTEQARQVLLNDLEQLDGWLKVHAAEALLALGERASVLDTFKREEQRLEEALISGGADGVWGGSSRVGLWRVLANASATDQERVVYIDRIKTIFREPGGAWRLHAVETLSKLEVVPELSLVKSVEDYIAESSSLDALYAHWLLARCTDSGKREASLRALGAALGSENPLERLRSAYALRHLKVKDQGVLAALEQAAAKEPLDGLPVAYVTGAAFVLTPSSELRQTSPWRLKLEALLQNGGPANARYEASQCLLLEPDAVRANVHVFERLLRADNPDTRIGAAWALLAMNLDEKTTN